MNSYELHGFCWSAPTRDQELPTITNQHVSWPLNKSVEQPMKSLTIFAGYVWAATMTYWLWIGSLIINPCVDQNHQHILIKHQPTTINGYSLSLTTIIPYFCCLFSKPFKKNSLSNTDDQHQPFSQMFGSNPLALSRLSLPSTACHIAP